MNTHTQAEQSRVKENGYAYGGECANEMVTFLIAHRQVGLHCCCCVDATAVVAAAAAF